MEEIGGFFFTLLMGLLAVVMFVEFLIWVLGLLLGIWWVFALAASGVWLARLSLRRLDEAMEENAVKAAEQMTKTGILADYTETRDAMRRLAEGK